ncbi:hypothetical protein EAG_12684 [Camponotus floridanus]|uniref:Uncharacterized protein n=1 Tax=Camponotus floridanus TaxID=104421 RepID=E2AXX7_CAMFO|nr:hypothetical protein EAG_12684 [Camponotus floridanus]
MRVVSSQGLLSIASIGGEEPDSPRHRRKVDLVLMRLDSAEDSPPTQIRRVLLKKIAVASSNKIIVFARGRVCNFHKLYPINEEMNQMHLVIPTRILDRPFSNRHTGYFLLGLYIQNILNIDKVYKLLFAGIVHTNILKAHFHNPVNPSLSSEWTNQDPA